MEALAGGCWTTVSCADRPQEFGITAKCLNSRYQPTCLWGEQRHPDDCGSFLQYGALGTSAQATICQGDYRSNSTSSFRIHGLPGDKVSDRGSQFVSRFWKAFCDLLLLVIILSEMDKQKGLTKCLRRVSSALSPRPHRDGANISYG